MKSLRFVKSYLNYTFTWDTFSSGSSYIRVKLENSGNTELYEKFKVR